MPLWHVRARAARARAHYLTHTFVCSAVSQGAHHTAASSAYTCVEVGGDAHGTTAAGCDARDDLSTEPDDAAFCAALVHGMIRETEALDTFSLDFRHPLSSLLAFAVCLAAQDWE